MFGWSNKKKAIKNDSKQSLKDEDNLEQPFPMKHAEFRYSSFIEFPYRVPWPISSFVDAGFFYTGVDDLVKCFLCGISIGNWNGKSCQDGGTLDGFELSGCDYPLLRHVEENDECPFAIKRLQVKKAEQTKLIYEGQDVCCSKEESDSGLVSCILQRQHINLLMESLERRLNTFNSTWNKNAKKSKTEVANAGFYYTGTGDVVRCFSCDVSLADWESNDDCIEEHLKYSPRCKYIAEMRVDVDAANNTSNDTDKEENIVDTIMGTERFKAINTFTSFNDADIRNAIMKRPELAMMIVAPVTSMDFDRSMDEFLETVRSLDTESGYRLKIDRFRRNALIEEACERASFKDHYLKKTAAIGNKKEQDDNSNLQCCICLDKKRNTIFVPCGHLSTCLACGQKLKRCPICRKKPEKVLSVFVS